MQYENNILVHIIQPRLPPSSPSARGGGIAPLLVFTLLHFSCVRPHHRRRFFLSDPFARGYFRKYIIMAPDRPRTLNGGNDTLKYYERARHLYGGVRYVKQPKRITGAVIEAAAAAVAEAMPGFRESTRLLRECLPFMPERRDLPIF